MLGAGAIGASVGALLHEAGARCVLIARGEHGRALAEGVELRFPETARRIRVPSAAALTEAAPRDDDLILLATMGQHTEAAIAPIPASIAVASFQNGLTPLDAIAHRGHPTLAAMVYVPAERRAPGVVTLPGVPVPGSILLGGWPRGQHRWGEWLVARLAAAGFRAEVERDIAPWIRAKLLVNVGGVVVALCDQPSSEVIEAARDEARAVWRAAGEPFEDIDALMARVGRLQTAAIDGRARVGGSTRAALARGDELETACLHASIIAGGRAVGVATPINEGLVRIAARAASEGWLPGSVEASALPRLLSS